MDGLWLDILISVTGPLTALAIWHIITGNVILCVSRVDRHIYTGSLKQVQPGISFSITARISSISVKPSDIYLKVIGQDTHPLPKMRIGPDPVGKTIQLDRGTKVTLTADIGHVRSQLQKERDENRVRVVVNVSGRRAKGKSPPFWL